MSLKNVYALLYYSDRETVKKKKNKNPSFSTFKRIYLDNNSPNVGFVFYDDKLLKFWIKH